MNAKILIAERDTVVRLNVVATLEAEGYSTTAAADGAQALRLFGQQNFDLLVLDSSLARADGCESMRQLRSRAKPLPFLILLAEEDRAERGFGAETSGEPECLPKPFETPALLARVEEILRRSGPVRRSVLEEFRR